MSIPIMSNLRVTRNWSYGQVIYGSATTRNETIEKMKGIHRFVCLLRLRVFFSNYSPTVTTNIASILHFVVFPN